MLAGIGKETVIYLHSNLSAEAEPLDLQTWVDEATQNVGDYYKS